MPVLGTADVLDTPAEGAFDETAVNGVVNIEVVRSGRWVILGGVIGRTLFRYLLEVYGVESFGGGDDPKF